MASKLFSPKPSGTEDKKDASSASTPSVTTIVSISLLLFAIIAQALAAIGVISPSPAVQVTIWLVVGALIVLILIADMACRAYVTANRCRSSEPPVAPPDSSKAWAQQPAEQGPSEPRNPDLRVVPPDGSDMPTTVRLKDGNAGDDASARHNSPRLPVNTADVFPTGCYLVPASISETYDYDEKNKTCRPAVDEITNQPVFQCRVVDMDPERKGRSRETEVKIVADQIPVPPTQAQYGAVEFEGLTAIPYATDRGRVAFDALRATGIQQAITRPAPGTEQARPAPGTENAA
jgi:hypothetical protein